MWADALAFLLHYYTLITIGIVNAYTNIMMKENGFEDSQVKIWIDDDHILHFIFKARINISIATAKKYVAKRLSISKGRHYPILTDLRNISGSDKEARKYLSQEGSVFITATALLTNNYFESIIGNFYIGVSNPNIPTRMFTSEKDALKWLSNYRK